MLFEKSLCRTPLLDFPKLFFFADFSALWTDKDKDLQPSTNLELDQLLIDVSSVVVVRFCLYNVP